MAMVLFTTELGEKEKTENRMHLLQIAKEHFRGGLKSEQARNDR